MIKDRLNELLKNESISSKVIIRDGKLSKTAGSTKPGYKIILNADGTKEEVKLSLEERLNRNRSARKIARKNKLKQKQTAVKQTESNEKRVDLKIGDHRKTPATSSRKLVDEADVSVETGYRRI